MLCSMFKKKSRTKDQNKFRRSLTYDVYVIKQASLLAAAAHTVEVSELKQSLERAEEELNLVKKQLEGDQGMQQPLHVC